MVSYINGQPKDNIMSIRLANLSVGNYILIFESDSTRMIESLCKVTERLTIGDTEEDYILKVRGLRKGSYNAIDVIDRSLSPTKNEVKFAILSTFDAHEWIRHNKIQEDVKKIFDDATRAMDTATIKVQLLDELMSVGPAFIEAAPQPPQAPRDPDIFDLNPPAPQPKSSTDLDDEIPF